MFLAYRKNLISSKKVLICVFSTLALLVIPNSGLTATLDTPTDQTQTLGSVLDQADHLRIRGKTPEQFKQALSLYQHAADNGFAVAQYWLGFMYFERGETESDLDKAMHWAFLSSKQAYPPAKELLSDIMQGEDDVGGC